MRRTMGLFGLLLFSALQTTAMADEAIRMPPRFVVGRNAEAKVVIVSPDSGGLPEVEQRITAELSSIGLDVLSVPTQASDLNGQLAEMGSQAVAHHAVASLRIFRGEGQRVVQAWIYDSVTKKMVFRQLVLRPEKGPDAMASVALQVVELLHASLLEIRLPEQRRVAQRAPAVVRKMVQVKLDRPPPLPGRWSLQSGLWLGWASGGDITSGGLSLAGSCRLVPWLSLEGEVLGPLLPSQVSDPRGKARAWLLMLQGMAWVEPLFDSRVSPGLGLGAGSLLISTAGESEAPYRGQSEWNAVSLLTLGARLAIRANPRLRILAWAGVDIMFPEVVVRFEQDAVAHIGRPLVSGGLAVEWSFGNQ